MAWIPRLLLVLLAGLAGPAMADYSTHPSAVALVDELVSKHGFDRASLTALMAAAARQDRILESISKPAEKTLAWHEYRKIFLGEDRIREGAEFWQQNQVALDRAFRTLGIPQEYVVAIIGVETRFGRHRGAWRVLDALTTLAFDYPPRAAFFRGELIQFLLLAREENKPAETLMGSYAGAMGFGQFIPSSYRHYAIDFDGDGGRDIWNNTSDAIGSVANYFAKHGWQGGTPLLVDVSEASAGLQALITTDPKPVNTLEEIRRAGFKGADDLAGDTPVAVLAFDQGDGAVPAVVFRDFYVITRYNHSPLYARAVHELAMAIREQNDGRQVEAAVGSE